MMDSIPTQIAETIQATHIRRHPDPAHDINPSTAASTVTLASIQDHDPSHCLHDHGDDDDIPHSSISPVPRQKQKFPPMPDLRFEQSYLHSISKAESWQGVVLITLKDQVILPLLQGVVYNLFLCGWQHWNTNARIHGDTIGAKVRRWWYGVNNWPIPATSRRR